MCSRTCRVFLVVLGLVISSNVWAEHSVLLKPNWTIGETTYIEFYFNNHDLEKGNIFPSEGRAVHSQIRLGFLRTVRGVTKAGFASLQMTVDRLAIRIRDENGDVHFDTDGIEGSRGHDSFGTKLRDLLGESVSVVVDHNGQVKYVGGNEQITRRLRPGKHEEYAGDLIILSACFTTAVQKSLWQQYYGCFAFEMAKPGHEWKRRICFSLPTDAHYTLEQLIQTPSGRQAVVTHTAHVEWPSHTTTTKDMLEKWGHYDASGRTVIDLDMGYIVSSKEDVVQEHCSKSESEDGTVQWWRSTEDKATHSFFSMTETEREKVKRVRAKRWRK